MPTLDPGGSWGVVIDPYRPDEMGPEFTLPSCGCVTFGSGPPSSTTVTGANEGDVYVDSLTEIAYQFQNNAWTIISGSSGAQQVYDFAGNPNGNVLVNTTLTCYCIDTLNSIAWVKTDHIISNTGWVLQ